MINYGSPNWSLFLEHSDSYPVRSIDLLEEKTLNEFIIQQVKKDAEMASIIICKLVPLMKIENPFKNDKRIKKLLQSAKGSFWIGKAISIIK